MLLSRRDVLDLAVRASALPGAAEFFAAWLRAATDSQHAAATNAFAPPEPPLLRDYQPKFFGVEDFAALQAFTEILIPTDDTPGAREAHCAHYIDFVLQAATDVMPDLQRASYRLIKQQNTFAFYTSRAGMIETLDYRGNSFNAGFPACTHPEHHTL